MGGGRLSATLCLLSERILCALWNTDPQSSIPLLQRGRGFPPPALPDMLSDERGRTVRPRRCCPDCPATLFPNHCLILSPARTRASAANNNGWHAAVRLWVGMEALVDPSPWPCSDAFGLCIDVDSAWDLESVPPMRSAFKACCHEHSRSMIPRQRIRSKVDGGRTAGGRQLGLADGGGGAQQWRPANWFQEAIYNICSVLFFRVLSCPVLCCSVPWSSVLFCNSGQ